MVLYIWAKNSSVGGDAPTAESEGKSGQFLMSNGPGAASTWGDPIAKPEKISGTGTE